MNDRGFYFAGFSGGMFKWSLNIKDAKPLTELGQFKTVERLEHPTEVVYEFI